MAARLITITVAADSSLFTAAEMPQGSKRVHHSEGGIHGSHPDAKAAQNIYAQMMGAEEMEKMTDVDMKRRLKALTEADRAAVKVMESRVREKFLGPYYLAPRVDGWGYGPYPLTQLPQKTQGQAHAWQWSTTQFRSGPYGYLG